MIILEAIVAMLATISFAILFNAPQKEVIHCGLTGALAWTIYYGMTQEGISSVFASLVASFGLTILSRAFAVIRKSPVTMYLLPRIGHE